MAGPKQSVAEVSHNSTSADDWSRSSRQVPLHLESVEEGAEIAILASVRDVGGLKQDFGVAAAHIVSEIETRVIRHSNHVPDAKASRQLTHAR